MEDIRRFKMKVLTGSKKTEKRPANPQVSNQVLIFA